MTHLGLGSSLEEPWGPTGGSNGVIFPGDGAILLGRLGCPVPGGHLQPCLTDLVGLLICPAWGELVDWGILFPSLEGRRAVAWEALLLSPEGRWAITWEELLPLLEGRRAVAWEELPPSPEGRWAIAWEELLPSPEGRWAAAGRELLPSPEGRWAGVVLGGTPDTWLLTGVIACEGLLASPRGKRSTCLTVCLGSVITFPQGEALACLPAWEPRLLDQIVALALVIFPCFLLIRILNLFNCLCLTLINLVSLTLFMKSWHSPNLSAEIIEASWVLQCSVCLVTWSKMLLMALTLAWSKSFFCFSDDLSCFGCS